MTEKSLTQKDNCIIEGCLNKVHGHNMCGKHLTRWKRYADPFRGDGRSAARSKGYTLEARFWSRVDKSGGLGPNGECWEWIGTPSKTYGQFGFQGVQYQSHRLAYTLTYGEIPEGLLACHKCDNPRCVRPDHLFLGTPLQNMQDKDAKGRGNYTRPYNQARGERVNTAKLTDDDVRNIRQKFKNGVTTKELTNQYPVNRHYLYRILNGTTWKHID